jgi:hypothetical protein
MPHLRGRPRAALLAVTLSAVGLGACADDADEPERAELRPVAQTRAPDTPVLDRGAAVPRSVGERRERRRARRARSLDGVQKASTGGSPGAAPRAQVPVASAPPPAPPASPSPAPPSSSPPAAPSKPPATGGSPARSKPREVQCSPRCP